MNDVSDPGRAALGGSARSGPPAPIKTPCIKVCVVDGESGLCLGCYRKLSEVAAWAKLTDGERDVIMAELPDRRRLIRPEKLAMF